MNDDADAVLRSVLETLSTRPPEQKLQMLITAYQAGDISLGRAAELWGVSFEEMKDLLRQRGIPIHLGPESIEELKDELSD